jgi:hypothetical protein
MYEHIVWIVVITIVLTAVIGAVAMMMDGDE